ncbi:hypothetical protein JCM11641_000670 [Rhodosporidiobolus odoratus]
MDAFSDNTTPATAVLVWLKSPGARVLARRSADFNTQLVCEDLPAGARGYAKKDENEQRRDPVSLALKVHQVLGAEGRRARQTALYHLYGRSSAEPYRHDSNVLNYLGIPETRLLYARIDNWALAFPVDEVFALFSQTYDRLFRGATPDNNDEISVSYADLLLKLVLMNGLVDSSDKMPSRTHQALCQWLKEEFPESIALFEHIFKDHYLKPRRWFENRGHNWANFLQFVGIMQPATFPHIEAGGSLASDPSGMPVVTVADFLCIAQYSVEAYVLFDLVPPPSPHLL